MEKHDHTAASPAAISGCDLWPVSGLASGIIPRQDTFPCGCTVVYCLALTRLPLRGQRRLEHAMHTGFPFTSEAKNAPQGTKRPRNGRGFIA